MTCHRACPLYGSVQHLKAIWRLINFLVWAELLPTSFPESLFTSRCGWPTVLVLMWGDVCFIAIAPTHHLKIRDSPWARTGSHNANYQEKVFLWTETAVQKDLCFSIPEDWILEGSPILHRYFRCLSVLQYLLHSPTFGLVSSHSVPNAKWSSKFEWKLEYFATLASQSSPCYLFKDP